MGYIEFARIDNDGVEWVDLSNATPAELLDFEIACFRKEHCKMEKDIFGFADAINLDHLNLEQLKELEKILDKIK
jgi:hypothetical protein